MLAIKSWAKKLGFSDCRITTLEVGEVVAGWQAWLARGWHGDMDYLAAHREIRTNPSALVPGSVRAICVTMPYLSSLEDWKNREWRGIAQADRANIALYARGRDYHKVMRNRLKKLAALITEKVSHTHRVFSDSAPIFEVELARRSGLGWRGKHTLLLNRSNGSMFFLGEIFTSLPLPVDEPSATHCGSCRACLDICPTQAIVAPYQLDARRCISYLTIELKGSIPTPLRPLIGNRVYGCDDCQLVCPWNKFAQMTSVPDFAPRRAVSEVELLDLWAWSESKFLKLTEGSAVRRIGYQRWRRNLAVGLGNALRNDPARADIRAALGAGLTEASPLVREHIEWALQQ